jgi:hypothetical protein
MYVELPGFVSEVGKIRCKKCMLKITKRCNKKLSVMLDEDVVTEDWLVGLCKCEKCKGVFIEEMVDERQFEEHEDTEALEEPWWERR